MESQFIGVGPYRINLANIAYIASPGEDRIQIYFVGREQPLPLNDEEGRTFALLYKRYTESLTEVGQAPVAGG